MYEIVLVHFLHLLAKILIQVKKTPLGISLFLNYWLASATALSAFAFKSLTSSCAFLSLAS